MGKNGNQFFGTENENNNNNTANSDVDFTDFDYNKYLDDYDDGEEIVPRSGHNENYQSDFEEVYSNSSPEQYQNNSMYFEYGNAVAEEDEESDDANDYYEKKRRSHKRIVTALICIILAIIIGAGGLVGYFYYIGREGRYGDSGLTKSSDKVAEDELFEDEDHEIMGTVTDADSLNDYLKNWANNDGELMSSKNVINVLLCGADTTDGGVGRSDSMILVSVNRKTKKVVLTSFFRDSYIYMEIPDEKGKKHGRYDKINAAFSLGGPATLIDTIEKNFKVDIDEFITVDFSSFKGIIDAIGGIDVDVEKYESDYIRATSKQKKFPSGKNCHLNGKQALIYSRIRKLDSDVNRTARQRKVINSLIKSAKGATKGQLVNAYKKVAKYLTTSYTQSEILSLIGTAVAQDWMSFEIKSQSVPAEDKEGVEMMSTMITTSSASGQWVWIVDYPLCAQNLQKAIYGESNIVLEKDRDTALKFLQANNINTTKASSSGNDSYYSYDDGGGSSSDYGGYGYGGYSYGGYGGDVGGGDVGGGDVGGGDVGGGDVGGGDVGGGDVGGGDVGGGDVGGGDVGGGDVGGGDTGGGGGFFENLFGN